MKKIKIVLLFFTIFFSVIIGFIILGITKNYCFWIIGIILSTIILGLINGLFLKIILNLINKYRKK